MFSRNALSKLTTFSFLLIILLVALVISACAPSAAPTANPPTGAPARPAQPIGAPAQATSAPAPTTAPAATAAPAGDSGASIPSNVAPIDRKIIKNAQLALTVQDTPGALFQITGISSDVGGYVIGSRTFGVGDRTGAQISIAVPVDRFEEAVNMVRHVALHIDQDMTSSAEVTDQYVDLESRLRNLQATATRLREFLTRADNITDTLKVNDQLTAIEQQSEEIQGKLNALNARTSFSTIAVDLNEPVPTEAPTATPTVTPTPTPIIWRPDQTFSTAATVQTSLFQGLVNALIWFVVVLLPYVLLALLVGLIVRWFVRKTRHTTSP